MQEAQKRYILPTVSSQADMKHAVFIGLKLHTILMFQDGCVER